MLRHVQHTSLALLLASCLAACFSDVSLPACVANDTPCVADAGGGTSGDSGRGSVAGGGRAGLDSGGAAGEAASAGSSDLGGTAGLGRAGEGGVGGDAGDAMGGIGGAEPSCSGCVLLPEVLPEPCESSDSTMAVAIVGGDAPFTWQVTAPASGWSVRPDPDNGSDQRHVLLQRAANATQNAVTLRVSDANGHELVSTYRTAPRKSCWFAYTSLVEGEARLTLTDPALERTPSRELPNDHGVFDFRFSPNGRFLAYRYGGSAADPASGHLTMIDLVTNFEWSVFPTEAVKAYAWAEDSHALAVAYASNGVTYLGGARITPGTAGAAPTVTQLLAVAAPVESELVWSASTFVAFHSSVLSALRTATPFANPSGLRLPYFAKLGSNGFSTPASNKSEYFEPGPDGPALWLRPTPSGFFAISANDPYALFYPSDEDYSVPHWSNVVSPSGAYSAQVLGSSLRVFRALDDVTDLQAGPFAEGLSQPGCAKLLAWASGRERIACVNDEPASASAVAHGELHLFDVSGPGPLSEVHVAGACVEASCPDTRYEYGVSQSDGAPRLLSDSGRWLAFTARASTKDYLYWVDLSSPTPFVRRDLALVTADGRASLAFSPDERYLLQQRGSFLTVHDLSAAPNSGPLSVPKTITEQMKEAPGDCVEDFDEDPVHWCGAPQRELPFQWGPDSTSIALRTTQGLTLASVLPSLGFSSRDLKANDCTVECSNRFAFQPRP